MEPSKSAEAKSATGTVIAWKKPNSGRAVRLDGLLVEGDRPEQPRRQPRRKTPEAAVERDAPEAGG